MLKFACTQVTKASLADREVLKMLNDRLRLYKAVTM